jgi:Flp pilus assembly pilin Flp
LEPNGGAVTPSELLALGGFINVTTLTARSTNRLSPRLFVSTSRFDSSDVQRAGKRARSRKGGESRMFKSLVALKREDGQTMAEYGVVLAVITLAIVVALAALSGAIGDAINAVTGVL